MSSMTALDRPALVLLPGLLCDERLWRDQAAALSDVADVSIPDLSQDASMGAMAARVLASAPRRFALAGLSMGGYVALEIMRRAPERVTRLALIDTSARQDDAKRAAQRRMGLAMAERGRFVGVSAAVLRELVHESRLDTEVGREVMAMAERVGRDAFMRQVRAILDRPDSRPDLSGILVPTLVAVGDADVRTPPAYAEEMHAGIHGSTYHVFDTCGHLPPLEVPEETTAVLRRWLLD
jgi:pimeloyl-ACP methyl ester carboxylesterase